MLRAKPCAQGWGLSQNPQDLTAGPPRAHRHSHETLTAMQWDQLSLPSPPALQTSPRGGLLKTESPYGLSSLRGANIGPQSKQGPTTKRDLVSHIHADLTAFLPLFLSPVASSHLCGTRVLAVGTLYAQGTGEAAGEAKGIQQTSVCESVARRPDSPAPEH